MALQKDITFNGVLISSAYCKLTNITGDKNLLKYDITVFKDKSFSSNDANKITSYSYSFVPSSEASALRWDKQAYEDAKTKAELIGAVDLLDEEQTS